MLLASLLAMSSSDVRPSPKTPRRLVVAEAPRAASIPPRTAPVTRNPAVRAAKKIRERGAAAIGYATYYARMFDGRTTASGTIFDSNDMVAAHPSYPFGTILRVTNLRTGSSTKVRVVDRGPAIGPRRSGVVIDLSRAAATSLGMIRAGRARVRLDVVPAE